MFTPTALWSATVILLLLYLFFETAAANEDLNCPVGCKCYPWLPRVHPAKIEANCSRLSLKTLSAHFKHHIVSLEASFNEIEKLSNNFLGENKTKLSKVNLSNNSISVIEEKAFALLPELWILNLTGNKIQFLHRDTFQRNPKLWYLILRGNNLDILEHSTFLNAHQIGKLDISYNNIRELKESTFSDMPNIVYLRLHNNQFRKLHGSWFRWLSKLERLFLENNLLTHLDADTFVYTPKLFELSLGWNKLVVPSDTPFLRVPNLEYLHLTGCDLGNLPTHMFELCPRVRMLWLGSNRLQSLSVELFQNLESLVFLNACDNRLKCTCDLREVWQICQYRQITTDVNCVLGERAELEVETKEENNGCTGRWDMLEKMACNASAHRVPLEDLDDDSGGGAIVTRVAAYAGVAATLLVALPTGTAAIWFCWKKRARPPQATRAAQSLIYPDMMPLNDDQDESS